MNSVVKRVLNGDWASLQTDVEKMAADKVQAKVDAKKVEVLAKINDISADKQKELIAVSSEGE